MRHDLGDKLRAGATLLPVMSLILLVIGAIYTGLATATSRGTGRAVLWC